MIQEHEINIKDSIIAYESSHGFIEPQLCYINVFHVVTNNYSKFVSKEWRVSYGYATAYEQLMTRHAFIIDSNGLAIDPTFAQFDWFKDREHKYVSFKIYDNVDDYIGAIRRNNNYPDLKIELHKLDLNAQEWAKDNDIILIG